LAAQIRDGTLSLEDFQEQLGATNDSITGVGAETMDFSESLTMLKNNLTTALGPAAARLFDTIGKSATEMAPSIIMIVEAMVPLIEAFASLPAPVLAGLIGVFAAGAMIGKLAGPIMTAVKAFQLLSAVMMANPWILLIAATIALGIVIVKNWDTIKAAVGKALEWIKEKIAVAWEYIKIIWTTVWETIANFFLEVWERIKGIVTGALNIIQNIVSTVWNVISGIITTVMGVIQTIITTGWNIIQGIVTTVMGVIQTVIQTEWDIISTIIQTVMGIIQGIVTTGWTIIQGIVTTVMGVIQTIIQTGWDIISTIITTVMGIIQGIVTTGWNIIQTVITTAVGIIQTIVQTAWSIIQTIIQTGMDIVRGVIETAWGIIVGIFEFAKGLIEGIIGGVVEIIDKVGGALNTAKEIAGQVWDFIVGKFQWAKDRIVELAGQIKNAALDALGPLGDIISGVGGLVGGGLDLLGFDTGGVVPGPKGAPRLVIAHGGETILPTHKPGYVQSFAAPRLDAPLRASDGPSSAGPVVVNVTLKDATIRSDHDVVLLARELGREQERLLNSKGVRTTAGGLR
jgi:phage-related protein